VQAETPTAAACSKLRLAGLGAIVPAFAVAYSAKVPSPMPNTSSPTLNPVTPLPTPATRPANSMPRTRALGVRTPTTNRTG
jgi:hypothetical protein